MLLALVADRVLSRGLQGDRCEIGDSVELELLLVARAIFQTMGSTTEILHLRSDLGEPWCGQGVARLWKGGGCEMMFDRPQLAAPRRSGNGGARRGAQAAESPRYVTSVALRASGCCFK